MKCYKEVPRDSTEFPKREKMEVIFSFFLNTLHLETVRESLLC